MPKPNKQQHFSKPKHRPASSTINNLQSKMSFQLSVSETQDNCLSDYVQHKKKTLLAHTVRKVEALII